MNPWIQVGLPGLVVAAMTLVGLELTPDDIRRALRRPALVATVLAAQTLLLPLAGAAVILMLRPAPEVTGGLILIAAASQATMSNLFCLLGRADVALSVTLTALSSAAALVVTPFAAALLHGWFLDGTGGHALPVDAVARQVLTGLILPIAAGMLVRHLAPGWVERWRERFRWTSLALLTALLTLIVAGSGVALRDHLGTMVLASALFTVLAAGAGAGLAGLLRWSAKDRLTMVAGFPARSLSIATLLAVNVLGRVEFLSFAFVFFVVQAVLIAPVMWRSRGRMPG